MKAIVKIIVIMLVLAFQPVLAQNSNANGNQNKNNLKVKKNTSQNNRGKSHSKVKDNRDYNDDDGGVYNDDDGLFRDDVYENKELKRQKVKNDNNGNGNAYGRNKGGLTGREFGQERARQARHKRDNKRQVLTRTVRVTTERTRTARERINEALEVLTEKRRRRAITEAQYTQRLAEVNRVEQQVMLLEDLLQRASSLNINVNIE